MTETNQSKKLPQQLQRWIEDLPPAMAAQNIASFHVAHTTLADPGEMQRLEVELVIDILAVHLATTQLLKYWMGDRIESLHPDTEFSELEGDDRVVPVYSTTFVALTSEAEIHSLREALGIDVGMSEPK